jgi:Response regulator containing CheY-like receiver, AAA-type ATPase, and DNA-binding domains
MRERILIVSDEQRNAWMQESLAQQGFSVALTEDANHAYEQLLGSPFELVIVELRDPASGTRFIKRLRKNPEQRQVLILTIAEWGTGQATMALTEGADGFEPGPVDNERLIAAVARLLRPNLTMIARASGDGDRD